MVIDGNNEITDSSGRHKFTFGGLTLRDRDIWKNLLGSNCCCFALKGASGCGCFGHDQLGGNTRADREPPGGIHVLSSLATSCGLEDVAGEKYV